MATLLSFGIEKLDIILTKIQAQGHGIVAFITNSMRIDVWHFKRNRYGTIKRISIYTIRINRHNLNANAKIGDCVNFMHMIDDIVSRCKQDVRYNDDPRFTLLQVQEIKATKAEHGWERKFSLIDIVSNPMLNTTNNHYLQKLLYVNSVFDSRALSIALWYIELRDGNVGIKDDYVHKLARLTVMNELCTLENSLRLHFNRCVAGYSVPLGVADFILCHNSNERLIPGYETLCVVFNLHAFGGFLATGYHFGNYTGRGLELGKLYALQEAEFIAEAKPNLPLQIACEISFFNHGKYFNNFGTFLRLWEKTFYP